MYPLIQMLGMITAPLQGIITSGSTALTLPLTDLIPAFLVDLIPGFDTLDLIMLGIRVVGLISIIHFVRSRITESVIATILVLVLSYLILFRWATLLLPILILVIFLPHGPLNLLFDIALGGGGGEEAAARKRRKA